jgi:putative endonuclease
VLRSLVDHDRYIGLTSDLDRRLKEHDRGHTQSTKARAPFELLHKEEFSSLKDARKREKYLKSGAGRRYLDKIKK